MDFKDATDEQLAAEVSRRGIKIPLAPPEEHSKIDFSVLLKTVRSGVLQTVQDGYESDGLHHYIYEAAIEAVYGPGYWNWKNKHWL